MRRTILASLSENARYWLKTKIVVRRLLMIISKSLGSRSFFVVDDLHEAEKIANTDKPDIALVDVNIERGSGSLNLYRSLEGRGIPVLFVSGLNLEENALAIRGFEPPKKTTKPAVFEDCTETDNVAARTSISTTQFLMT